MTIVKIRKYKRANILILNEHQKFVYIIFYKGQFYANEFEINKNGEYTNREYIQALDATLLAAKKTIEIIKERSSIINKIKQYVTTIKISSIRGEAREENSKTTSLS